MKAHQKQPRPVSHTIQHKTKAANQAPIQQVLQRYREKTVQRAENLEEDEELLQGKFEKTAQRMDLEEEEEPLQGKFEVTQREETDHSSFLTPHSSLNNTGLPDDLKSGVENLSGYNMDDVRVHYNSSKPAQLQALAYTQGSDIHVAPGREKHLPHEAWHVVQQKQGRVQPTLQLQGINVNDDERLEQEADKLGFSSLNAKSKIEGNTLQTKTTNSGNYILQRISPEISSLILQIKGLFKRGKALLITSMTDTVEHENITSYQNLIKHAEIKLAKYVEGNKIVLDDKPQINPMLMDEPIFITNETIHITPKYLNIGNQAIQARMLFDLLTSDKVIDKTLFYFLDQTTFEFKDQQDLTLFAGCTLFRVLNAASAYKYIANGISRVGNREGWTELGKGFYTSPDFEGSEIYTSTVGKPAAIIEMKLEEDALGKVFNDTKMLNGKSEKDIEDNFEVTNFVTDKDISQIKFHNPFYRESLTISKVYVINDQLNWDQYTTEEFIDSYRQHIILRHKTHSKKDFISPMKTQTLTKITEVRNPSSELLSATNAPEHIIDKIRYIDWAMKFETKLGDFLSTYQPALDQVSRLVSAIWNKVEEKDKIKLGTNRPENTGMVGDDLISLKAVVDRGNLREKFTFLYNGYQQNILGKLERPSFFQENRRGREIRPVEDKEHLGKIHPLYLHLPLSDQEWFGAVNKDGKLGWQPGGVKYHYKMSTDFQQKAEALLIPIAAGISGTAYGILQMAEKLSQDTQVNYKLVRLGLLGWMIPAKDHTFHEIMVACSLFNSKELSYDPSLCRYKLIPPLSTEFLRNNIAPKKLFPDEIFL